MNHRPHFPIQVLTHQGGLIVAAARNHSEIGAHEQNNLASFLSRCDTVLASIQNTANLPTLKLKGWTDAETTAFTTARSGFGPAEQVPQTGDWRSEGQHHGQWPCPEIADYWPYISFTDCQNFILPAPSKKFPSRQK